MIGASTMAHEKTLLEKCCMVINVLLVLSISHIHKIKRNVTPNRIIVVVVTAFNVFCVVLASDT